MPTRFQVGDRVRFLVPGSPQGLGVIREVDPGGLLDFTQYLILPDADLYPGPPPPARWVGEPYCLAEAEGEG